MDTSPSAGKSPGTALDAALAAAERVLAHRFGSAITLSEPEDLAGSGPAVVVRARVKSSPFSLPRTLVIKHYDATAGQRHTDAYATEAVSYQLFTALTSEDRMCPELIGHDATDRVLVLTDLGRAQTLEEKLHLPDSRSAERSLLSWARALGRMHASTATREPDFNALLRRLGAQPCRDKGSTDASDQLPKGLRSALDVVTPRTVRAKVRAAAARVHGGEFRAFSPVDLGPDNNLVTSHGVRFLDFEHGCVRNALIDVAHLRVPFAFWQGALALPAGMSEAMIAAWRSEVRETWPALDDDDTFGAALLDSQVTCVWTQTWQELPGLVESPPTGQVSRAAALESWWRELGTRAAQRGVDDIADHANAVAGALDERFGPGLELPIYPAFG